MAYFFPFRLSVPALAIGLLSGCCANNVCDVDDTQEDVIKLTFSDKFTTADLDTLYLYRYPLKSTANIRPELVTLIRPGARPNDTIFLNNTTPFSQIGTARLNQYRYQIRYNYDTIPRQIRGRIALVIDLVTLKGTFEGNGCCTYYKNTDKKILFRTDTTGTATLYDLKPRPFFTIIKRKVR